MSASLVGSEMCIRDSSLAGSAAGTGSCRGGAASEQRANCDAEPIAWRRRSSCVAEPIAGRRRSR
eukprot:12034768-Alexandrium_andersonii.AAC.1